MRFWFVLISVILLMACATSPTGRAQIKLFSKSQLDNMGQQTFASLKQEQPVSASKVENRFVECVANAITAQVPASVFSGSWEVVVFDDKQVNAFALPGGKIGVYTGLLTVTENADQLAAVIGHEVGHVIAEHGNERMSNSTLVGIGLEATNAMLDANQVGNSQLIMAAIGAGAQVGITLPFSRTHESEADLIGLNLMAQAGFDPRQSVNLWQNMAKVGGEGPMEFLSTHPAPQTRINDLQKNMPHALEIASQAKQHPTCPK